MTVSDNLSAIEKALEGVKHAPGPWSAEATSVYCDDKTGQRVASTNGEYLFWSEKQKEANAAYIAACSPDRMREVLAAAREAEALTGIGSAHGLISDWLGEGTDDLPDDTPVRIEIGKRTIIADTLGSLRRARALLSKESADAGGSAIKSTGGDHG